MASIATSSTAVPISGEGTVNPNPTVGVEGTNPQHAAVVESPEIQALGGTGGVVMAEPLQSVPENHFSAWDCESSISGDDLPGIREKYAIPEGISLRVPSVNERACSAIEGETCIYVGALEGGLRLPIPVVVREILSHFKLSPGQLTPNAWRTLIGCAVLFSACTDGKKSLSLRAFQHVYSLKESPNANGWWYFSKREKGLDMVKGLPSSNKAWKDKFFFVSGREWEFCSWEEKRHFPINGKWGFPSSSSKYTLA